MRKLTRNGYIYYLALTILLHLAAVVQGQDQHGEETKNHSNHQASNNNHSVHSDHEGQIVVAAFNFRPVETPFIIATFLILTAICKLGRKVYI